MLVKVDPELWPELAGWLPPGGSVSELRRQVVLRAFRDVGILEVPNGSNRGVRLDRMCKRAGVPLGSWWCAVWAGLVWADCGALVPEGFPSTDRWLPFVKEGREKAIPEPGDAIVYGLKKKGPVVDWGDAHHIGILVRVPDLTQGQLITLSVEGNRAFSGSASNNGVAVDVGPVLRRDILGYIAPKIA